MTLPKPRFFDEIRKSRHILLADAGGGFDIYCGSPIYFDLLDMGKEVYLANLSFADIRSSTAEEVGQFAVEVKATTRGRESYFPELHLARWLKGQGYPDLIYAFDNLGVQPLKASYELLVERLGLDAIVLIDGGDGGTNSLMRGDEADLGTPQEDAASIAAVYYLDSPIAKFMVCLGFGVDAHHGVPHFDVLSAIAQLTRTSDYLGAWSLTPDMTGVQRYRAASEYASKPCHVILASFLARYWTRFLASLVTSIAPSAQQEASCLSIR